jgi:hypothetical protein
VFDDPVGGGFYKKSKGKRKENQIDQKNSQ